MAIAINPLMTATRNNEAIKLKLCILFNSASRESQIFFHQSMFIRLGDTASGHFWPSGCRQIMTGKTQILENDFFMIYLSKKHLKKI